MMIYDTDISSGPISIWNTPGRVAHRCKVFLDGEPLTECVEFSIPGRWVRVRDTSRLNLMKQVDDPWLEMHYCSTFGTKILFGNVTVENADGDAFSPSIYMNQVVEDGAVPRSWIAEGY